MPLELTFQMIMDSNSLAVATRLISAVAIAIAAVAVELLLIVCRAVILEL
jgi:hypothetical protein